MEAARLQGTSTMLLGPMRQRPGAATDHYRMCTVAKLRERTSPLRALKVKGIAQRPRSFEKTRFGG